MVLDEPTTALGADVVCTSSSPRTSRRAASRSSHASGPLAATSKRAAVAMTPFDAAIVDPPPTGT
jgi:hypothetical protein